MSTAGLIAAAIPRRPSVAAQRRQVVWCTTEGATVSGAGALMVIGVVALALALGVLVVILRRIPARLPGPPNAALLADQAQAQADAEQTRARALAEADQI